MRDLSRTAHVARRLPVRRLTPAARTGPHAVRRARRFPSEARGSAGEKWGTFPYFPSACPVGGLVPGAWPDGTWRRDAAEKWGTFPYFLSTCPAGGLVPRAWPSGTWHRDAAEIGKRPLFFLFFARY